MQTILVVEDDAEVSDHVAAVLRGQGYGVVSAHDGAEALAYLRAGSRPDLILLDMLLPVLDGWHFLEQLRRLGTQPPAPVLVTTATVLSREWAESHGCCGFVRKPFQPEELLDEVRRCLGRA